MSLREELEELAGIAVWLLAVEIQQAKEDILTTLDEAVTRIQTDVNNAISALGDVQAARDALGQQGADVTKLSAAADQLEGALGNISPTLGQVTSGGTDAGSTATSDTGGASTDTGTSGSSTSATS